MAALRADLGPRRFYGIIDLGYVGLSEALGRAERMIEGGVDVLQLRAKNHSADDISKLAAALHHLTAARDTPLVINDHPEIARSIGAEGIHVGQDDLPIAEVRKIVGRNCLVGKSTHSLEQAIRAADEGANYIGFGPIFATPTKPDYAPVGLDQIRAVHAAVPLPIYCIGGIKLQNLPEVLAAGAQRVVIVSGLLQAADAGEYARSVRKLLTSDL